MYFLCQFFYFNFDSSISFSYSEKKNTLSINSAPGIFSL